MLHYPAFITRDGSTWRIRFPDMDGLTGEGKTENEAYRHAQIVLREFITQQRMLGQDAAIPAPSDLASVLGQPMSAAILVPCLMETGQYVKLNISLDIGMLEAIDDAAEKSGLSRSAFLALAANDRIAAIQSGESTIDFSEVPDSPLHILARDIPHTTDETCEHPGCSAFRRLVAAGAKMRLRTGRGCELAMLAAAGPSGLSDVELVALRKQLLSHHKIKLVGSIANNAHAIHADWAAHGESVPNPVRPGRARVRKTAGILRKLRAEDRYVLEFLD